MEKKYYLPYNEQPKFLRYHCESCGNTADYVHKDLVFTKNYVYEGDSKSWHKEYGKSTHRFLCEDCYNELED